MLHLKIKDYHVNEDDENVVFHPVIVDIPTFAKEFEVLEFRLKNTLVINRKLYEKLTDAITDKVSIKLNLKVNKKGGKHVPISKNS